MTQDTTERRRQGRRAELALINARISTTEEEGLHTIGISGQTIAYVEPASRTEEVTDQDTLVVDLAGRRVVPGLIDSHIHAVRAGLAWDQELRWDRLTSLAEGLELVRKSAMDPPENGWVTIAGGWHPGQFAEARVPTRQELDTVAPRTPVYIQQGYSQAVVNTIGLAWLGIAGGGTNPSAGDYERDPVTEEPTGVIRGMPAFAHCLDVILRNDSTAQIRSTKAFFSELAALGLTGVIDMGGGSRIGPDSYNTIYRLHQDGDLTIRTRLFVHPSHGGDELEEIRQYVKYVRPGFGDPMLRVVGMGEILLGACYDGPGFASLSLSVETLHALQEATELLVQNAWPVNIHAVRDDTMNAILDVWDALGVSDRIKNLRFSVSHGDFFEKSTLQRLAAIGAGITIQDRLVIRARDSAENLGERAVQEGPPLRSMIDLGIPIGGGTDATVAVPYNPWLALWWMITGQPIDGGPVRDKQHRLSRQEALDTYTRGSAWFSFEEKKRGTMKVGAFADLAVLDADYFAVAEESIPDIQSTLTLVGGRPSHASGDLSYVADEVHFY